MKFATLLAPAARSSRFERSSEFAHPYQYSVDLLDSGIHVDLTGTTHTGRMRFRFPSGTTTGWLVADNNARKGAGWTRWDAGRGEVTACNPAFRTYAGNGRSAGFSGYFVAQFDRPMTSGGTYREAARHPGRGSEPSGRKPTGVYTGFSPGEDATLEEGLRGFDGETAYALMRHNAMAVATAAQKANGEERRGLESYLRLGYLPLEDHVRGAFPKDEQVSRTLEYACDDSLVGSMAGNLGHTGDAGLFAQRAANWHNVFDPAVGFVRGRHADGAWITPFDPAAPARYVTEANPWQYTFFVPQDIPGLIHAVGGAEAFYRQAGRPVRPSSLRPGQRAEPRHRVSL